MGRLSCGWGEKGIAPGLRARVPCFLSHGVLRVALLCTARDTLRPPPALPLQIGAQSVADGDVREGDAHAHLTGSLGRDEHEATLEIEDTQRQIQALAQRLHALHERRFRIVNAAETERM